VNGVDVEVEVRHQEADGMGQGFDGDFGVGLAQEVLPDGVLFNGGERFDIDR
jgi:hypothetical protein